MKVYRGTLDGLKRLEQVKVGAGNRNKVNDVICYFIFFPQRDLENKQSTGMDPETVYS